MDNSKETPSGNDSANSADSSKPYTGGLDRLIDLMEAKGGRVERVKIGKGADGKTEYTYDISETAFNGRLEKACQLTGHNELMADAVQDIRGWLSKLFNSGQKQLAYRLLQLLEGDDSNSMFRETENLGPDDLKARIEKIAQKGFKDDGVIDLVSKFKQWAEPLITMYETSVTVLEKLEKGQPKDEKAKPERLTVTPQHIMERFEELVRRNTALAGGVFLSHMSTADHEGIVVSEAMLTGMTGWLDDVNQLIRWLNVFENIDEEKLKLESLV